jgi:hypothetical protein
MEAHLVSLLQSVQNNATFYLDAYITRTGRSPNPADPTYPSSGEVLHVRKRSSFLPHVTPFFAHLRFPTALIRYAQQKRVRATKNLLSGSKNDEKEKEKEAEEAAHDKATLPIISYYYPNVTLELVCDSGNLPLQNLPEPLREREFAFLSSFFSPF